MKETLLKGIVYLTIASFIFIVSGYILNIILGRLLGPSNYGIYGLIISIVTFVNIIQSSGITQSISRFIAYDQRYENSILKAGIILELVAGTFFFCVFFFFPKVIADLLRDASLAPYIRLSAFIFPVYGFYGLYSDYYNGLHKFRKQAILNSSYSILKLCFVLVLSILFGLTGVIYGLILAPIIPILIGFRLPHSNKYTFPFKKIVVFSLPLIIISLISNLQQSLDLYFVKILLNSNHLTGNYVASQNIAKIPIFSMSSLFLVLFPVISRSINARDTKTTKKIINKFIRIIIMITFPMAVLISTTSSELITFVYTSAYAEAAPSLSLLIFGLTFFTIYTAFTYILSASGLQKLTVVISIVSIFLLSLLYVILIPKYALLGAATATTIGNLFCMTILGCYILYKYKTLVSLKSLINISLISIIIYILSTLTHFTDILLFIKYIVLFIIYFLFLYLIKEITKDDTDSLKSLLPKQLLKYIRI
jgi:stage V sporulation protein B